VTTLSCGHALMAGTNIAHGSHDSAFGAHNNN
jgi:hypothetical protein